MALYRVRPGFEHGAFGQFKAGDTVEHTEREAAGFADKLELVVETTPPPVTFDVTGSSVTEVIKAVTEGAISADDAIVAEYAGKKRKTLIEALLGIKNGAHGE